VSSEDFISFAEAHRAHAEISTIAQTVSNIVPTLAGADKDF
jgi:hypothetical protein